MFDERQPKPRMIIVTTVGNTFRSLLRDQVQFLSQHFDVHLICSYSEEVVAIAKNANVHYHPIAMKRNISPLADARSLWAMYQRFRLVKPDIVQSFTPKAGLLAMMAAKMAGIGVRVHSFTGLIFPYRQGVQRALLRQTDAITAWCASDVVPESSGVAESLQNEKVTSKPLALIGNGNIVGVDLSRLNPDESDLTSQATAIRKEWELPPEATVFCFIGRLNKDKGIGELLAAFEALDESCYLVLLGSLDDTAPISVAQQDAIAAHPRIFAMGFVRDVRPYLMASDLFVLPSYREGFPNAMLEAAALGLPLIVTEVNGATDFITNDVNGWLVPIADENALLDRMAAAAKLPPIARAKMGQKGRDLVARDYERNGHHMRLLDYYRERLRMWSKKGDV